MATGDHGAGRVSSIVNLTNTIIGAGLLAMPYAMKANGICLGCLVLFVSGWASATGLYLQGLSAAFVESRTASYAKISRLTYPSLGVLFDVAIALKSFGVGASYMIVVGDLMPQVCKFFASLDHPALVSKNVWILAGFCVAGPLAALRQIDSFKYTSLMALVAVGYLATLVSCVYLFQDLSGIQRGTVRMEPVSVWSTVFSLPVLVFGFTCHHNMYSILNELKDTSHRSVLVVITSSVGAAFVLYLSVGVFGYLTYGDNVGGNIISMYDEDSWTCAIGRLAIVALVLLSFPLQVHPCRASLNHIYDWFSRTGSGLAMDPASGASLPLLGGQMRATHMSKARHWLLTAAIVLASYVTATSVDSLQVMLAFVGSTGSTAISYILPGMFAYTLVGSKVPLDANGYDFATSQTSSLPVRRISLVLVTWGVFIFVVCSSTNLWLYT